MKIGNTHNRGGWEKEMVSFSKAPKYVQKSIIKANEGIAPDGYIYIEKTSSFGEHTGYFAIVNQKELTIPALSRSHY